MKAFLLFGGLFLTITVSSLAQSRVSIAPSYWFNYNPYSYQANLTYNGSSTQFLASGYNIVSSFGLTARYHFTPQWNLSIGVLYNRSTNFTKSPKSSYGDPTPFTTEGWQLPVLVNYRLTSRRLSPYFSTGALFTKSKTFTKAPIRTDGVAGVGLDYRFDSGLSLLLQPTASYSFTKFASDPFYQVTNYSFYSIGFQTQFIWHF